MIRINIERYRSWAAALSDDDLENEYYRLALFFLMSSEDLESVFSIIEELCIERGIEILDE